MPERAPSIAAKRLMVGLCVVQQVEQWCVGMIDGGGHIDASQAFKDTGLSAGIVLSAGGALGLYGCVRVVVLQKAGPQGGVGERVAELAVVKGEVTEGVVVGGRRGWWGRGQGEGGDAEGRGGQGAEKGGGEQGGRGG